MTRERFTALVSGEQKKLRQFLLALCCGHADEADDAFRHQALYAALATLPPKERTAILLYYLKGYSIHEISQIEDCSEEAVRKQMSRGRDELKKICKRNDTGLF